jgi:cytochrome P450
MDNQTPALAQRPSHVPAELVRDVDLFNLKGASEDVHQAWKALQTEAPRIFWTPRNGGYWMITRATDIEAVQKDHEHFAMKGMLVPNNPRPFPAPPLDFEPPDHAPWRIMISPAFSPKVIAVVEEKVRSVTIGLIEDMKTRGECEFVSEFTKVLPIVVFLTMMNLPPEDREVLMPHADVIARSPDPKSIHEARLALKAYIQKAVDERKEHPCDDLITKIMDGKIGGQPIGEEYVVGMCALLLSGGLDTVKNLLGFIAKFLATHPDHIDWILAHPDSIDHVVEELIRRHGVSNTARLVSKDIDFLGVTLKAGDQLQGATALFGLDDETVTDPMKVDFERPAPIPHAAFGNGVHRCPGSILAKREVKVWLQEWLPRISRFGIKPGTVPVQNAGMVNNVSELWLSWDPDQPSLL